MTPGILQCVAGPVDEVRLDAVHETAVHETAVHETPADASDGSPEQDDDRGRDDEADDGVCQREAEHHADDAKHDGEGRESVQACVDVVRDVIGLADFLSDHSAVDGDDFVARKAEETGYCDEPEVVEALGVEQSVIGFPGDDDGGECNDSDNEEASEVFGASEAVGVMAGRDPPAKDECDPERNGDEGVGEVVDCAGQQGNGAAGEEDRARTRAWPRDPPIGHCTRPQPRPRPA